MAFTPIQFDSGRLVQIPCATGQTIVKGDALSNVDGTGYYTTVSGGDGVTPTHVAMEDVTTTANGDMVTCIRTDGVVFKADTDAAVSVVDVGTYADLASKSTVDPDASTDDIFFIESIVGGMGAAESSKAVIGWFTRGTPNS